MRIYVKHRYRGYYTNEQWIEPGTYDSSDPALHGLAQYLVDNDHADVLELDRAPLLEAADGDEALNDEQAEKERLQGRYQNTAALYEIEPDPNFRRWGIPRLLDEIEALEDDTP